VVRRVLPVRRAGGRRPSAWAGPPPLLLLATALGILVAPAVASEAPPAPALAKPATVTTSPRSVEPRLVLQVTSGPLQGGQGVHGVAPVRRALDIGVASMNLFAQQGAAQAAADARRLTSDPAVDLVGWQETQNFGGVLASLPKAWRSATVPRPDGIGEIAVSWRRDRFRLERVRLLAGTDGVAAGEGPYPFGGRGILVVTLTERSTGHRLSVVNVHLPPQSESPTSPGRWAATLNADRSREHLARIAQVWRGIPSRWVVGTGDYNFDATADLRRRPAGGPVATLGRLASSTYQQLGTDVRPTYPSLGRRIDYVWVDRDALRRDRIEVRAHRALGGFHSDHRPLLATLRLS
jgi:endonuclease/exonuclease/phosphatase family protein